MKTLLNERLETIVKATTGHTKGPWGWEINKKVKQVKLASAGSVVMDFVRYGMDRAMPRFVLDKLLCRSDNMAVVRKGREHHKDWSMTLSHPDADLIRHAPELLALACAFASKLEALESAPSPTPWQDRKRAFLAEQDAVDRRKEWEAPRLIEGCQRSHPHEGMSCECIIATENARRNAGA